MMTVQDLDRQLNGYWDRETNGHVPGVLEKLADMDEMKKDITSTRKMIGRLTIAVYIIVVTLVPESLSKFPWEAFGTFVTSIFPH